jgi:hypothetical protein
LYVIQAENGGPIKIGIANDIENRLNGLQTGNPNELKIVVSVFNVEASAERDLHEKYKDYRLSGEWFDEAIIDRVISDLPGYKKHYTRDGKKIEHVKTEGRPRAVDGIRAKKRKDGYQMVHFEEYPEHWISTPETDRFKALAYARRNRDRLINRKNHDMAFYCAGFFDPSGPWVSRIMTLAFGGGPPAPRRVLEGIFSVLRTGIQWKALPAEYGVAGNIHQAAGKDLVIGGYGAYPASGGRKTGERAGPGVQGAAAGGGGQPFAVEPFQETADTV